MKHGQEIRFGWVRTMSAIAVVLIALILAACSSSPSTPSETEPETGMVLRYGAPDGRQALIEISPFEVGRNTFRVTVMDAQSQRAEAGSVDLRFSRLEDATEATEVPATATEHGESYVAEYDLEETGWWHFDVVLDEAEVISFYVRLDSPSRAPLGFDRADYPSDPTAEALFRRTVEGYEGLASVKTREELTSGLLAPTGTGVSIVTDGELEAPDRIHYVTSSTASTPYESYRTGTQSCRRDPDSAPPWQCNESEGQAAFNLDYMEKATPFRLGRREVADGEMSRVLLLYNPGQGAWFAWWIGEETGYLRRQAMVAPGHFMLTRYFDHNVPINIEVPSEAMTQGG
jgi:hypothetical protein